MKNNFLKTLIILFIFFKPGTCLASHAMGGEITYECLGGNQYRITMNLIRDCSGIPLNPVLTVDISNSCGYSSPLSITLSLVGNPQVVSLPCATGLPTCLGGTDFGMEIHTYEGSIVLPGSCQDWKFGHIVVNRNAGISTTVGGENDSLYISSLINNTNSICNNSPIFFSMATGVFYQGNSSCFDQGSYDIDGDSLSFELIAPKTGPLPGDTVTYLNGYSANHPILSSSPITFDSLSGQMCFTATQQENSIFATVVSEFRNGILIGQVERDIQLRILFDPTSNSTPTLSGYNGTNVFNIVACPGIPIDLFIAAYDSNATEDVAMYWDHSIIGATLTTNVSALSNLDTGYFSWTPTLADVTFTPYCFNVTVRDDHCGFIGVHTQQYCITVYPLSDPYCINPGIVENTIESGFKLFPNPANDELQLIVESDDDQKFSLFNSIGQEVFSTENIKGATKIINVASWPRGIYEAVMLNNSKKSCKRIILQ